MYIYPHPSKSMASGQPILDPIFHKPQVGSAKDINRPCRTGLVPKVQPDICPKVPARAVVLTIPGMTAVDTTPPWAHLHNIPPSFCAPPPS